MSFTQFSPTCGRMPLPAMSLWPGRQPHRRTGQHPFGGGQTEFCPNGFSGGGVVAEIFRDPYSVGGGSSRNFAGSIFCGGGGK